MIWIPQSGYSGRIVFVIQGVKIFIPTNKAVIVLSYDASLYNIHPRLKQEQNSDDASY